VDAKANDITQVGAPDIAQMIEAEGVVVVALRLRDAAGRMISINTYVQGKDDASYQKLNALKQQKLKMKTAATAVGDERVVSVQIGNEGKQTALGVKLTLVDHMGTRLLPALYSDNYITLFPGETRTVEIRYPAKLGARATVKVRAWNVASASVRVAGG
jgi:uncharacterized membrane protein